MNTADNNYSDTLLKIEKIKYLISELEQKVYSQIPQGIVNKFDESKKSLLNWIEEIEFTINDYQNQ